MLDLNVYNINNRSYLLVSNRMKSRFTCSFGRSDVIVETWLIKRFGY